MDNPQDADADETTTTKNPKASQQDKKLTIEYF
jgi:hypothetical protein